MVQKTLDVGFLHLNELRIVDSQTRCKKDVYAELFGHFPTEKISTYCCAQFVVHKSRILQVSYDFFYKMKTMMDGPSPDSCADVTGHSTHCLVFESLWHVIFGEPTGYPRRGENVNLPLFLRFEQDFESKMPRGSRFLTDTRSALVFWFFKKIDVWKDRCIWSECSQKQEWAK